MKYTLIAYKPEESYWCGGNKEIHSAFLTREDNLTRDEVVNKIFELSKDPEYLKDGSYFYSDCPYEDFHIFEYKEENKEEFDDFYFIKEEARKLAFDFNKEGKRKRDERWAKEKTEKDKKELEKKKSEYEKLKLEFEGRK